MESPSLQTRHLVWAVLTLKYMRKVHKISKEVKDQIIKRVKEEGVSVHQAAKDHEVSTKILYTR